MLDTSVVNSAGGFDRVVSQVVDAARLAASADNSQPWRFTLQGGVLSVSWRESREPPLFGPQHPATALSVGGVLENIHTVCEDLGVGVDMVDPQDFGAGQHVYFSVRLSAAQDKTVASGVSPSDVRHTNRLPFRREPLPAALLAVLRSTVEGEAKIAVYDTPSAVKKWADLVDLASRIRFRTQDVHEGLARSLRFSDVEVDRNDGLDVRTLHLPPGGSAFLRFVCPWKRMRALNRFGAFRFMARMEAQPLREAPALIAVIGRSEWGEVVAAGRLLHRVWECLNREGVAVHPYYVISDQLHRFGERTVPEPCRGEAAVFAEAVGAQADLKEGETIHMLLRVGFPVKIPVRSRRLPLSDLFEKR